MDTKNFTTKEQSERLIACGVNIETADYTISGKMIVDHEQGTPRGKKEIPCWSLAALIAQLDETVTTDDGDFDLHIFVENGGYYVQYDDNYEGKILVESGFQEHLIDAVFDVIIKLNELEY